MEDNKTKSIKSIISNNTSESRLNTQLGYPNIVEVDQILVENDELKFITSKNTVINISHNTDIAELKKEVELKADKTDVYTKEEVDKLMSTIFVYKGSVDSYEDLPKSDNKVGDVWNVVKAHIEDPKFNAGANLAWNGESWDVLEGVIDLSNYVTKDELSIEVEKLNSSISSIKLTKKSDLQYELEVNNNSVGTIDIPKDKYLSSSRLSGTELILSMESGEEIKVDLSSLSDVYTPKANGGISIDNKEVSLMLDGSTESFLTLGESGLKLSGVKDYVDNKGVFNLGVLGSFNDLPKAAEVDEVFDYKNVILTFQVKSHYGEENGSILNIVTGDKVYQTLFWKDFIQKRVLSKSEDGEVISSTFYRYDPSCSTFPNKSINLMKLKGFTTETSSEDIKSAFTDSRYNTILDEDDLDKCLTHGYVIKDQVMQSNTIFVGWTGSAYSLIFFGLINPMSGFNITTLTLSVSEGNYKIISNPISGEVLLKNSKEFTDLVDKVNGIKVPTKLSEFANDSDFTTTSKLTEESDRAKRVESDLSEEVTNLKSLIDSLTERVAQLESSK